MRRFWWPALADLACVLALAIGGQRSHDSGNTGDMVWAVLGIAWPFAVGAVAAHAGLVVQGRPAGRLWPDGVTVLATAYVLGMLLRAASGRGLAPAFLVVAGLFLAATMLGWRVIALLLDRRQRQPST
jgi:hypothetical protein